MTSEINYSRNIQTNAWKLKFNVSLSEMGVNSAPLVIELMATENCLNFVVVYDYVIHFVHFI